MPRRELTPLVTCERGRNLVSTCSGRKTRMSELPTSPSGSRRPAFKHKPNFRLVYILHYPFSMYGRHRVPGTLSEFRAILTIGALVAATRTAKGE